MKKLISFLLAGIMVLSLAACGGGEAETTTKPKGKTNNAIAELEKKYSGLTTDKLKWEYDASTQTITISGEGAMRDYLKEAPEWDKYNSEVKHAVIADGVSSVGAGAFYSFSVLADVKLADSVEFIGDGAFDYCTGLWTVNFPANLKYTGKRAFYNNVLHSDNGFVFPEGMLYIGEEAFHSAFKESYVSIPASLTVIETDAFDNMFVDEFRVNQENSAYTSDNGILYDKNMTTLINYPAGKTDSVYEIPETVTTILTGAIEVTNTLEKIVIPAGVTKIGEGAFFWNYALKNIEVNENNKNYTVVDGVLFTKDGKNLICYPGALEKTEYTIPEGCEKIGNYAMSQASNLIALHTNAELTQIGDYGLYGCQNLNRIDFPKCLKKIGVYATGACGALEKINYAGSEALWKNVEIEKYNDLLTNGSVAMVYAE